MTIDDETGESHIFLLYTLAFSEYDYEAEHTIEQNQFEVGGDRLVAVLYIPVWCQEKTVGNSSTSQPGPALPA